MLVVVAVVVGVWLLLLGAGEKRGGDKIFVESVAAVTGIGSGVQNRYSGVVEPQKTWEVKKSADKTVKEVFVKEGDQVEAGTPLFEYDTASIKDEIAQAKLELEDDTPTSCDECSWASKLYRNCADCPRYKKMKENEKEET